MVMYINTHMHAHIDTHTNSHPQSYHTHTQKADLTLLCGSAHVFLYRIMFQTGRLFPKYILETTAFSSRTYRQRCARRWFSFTVLRSPYRKGFLGIVVVVLRGWTRGEKSCQFCFVGCIHL